MAKVLDNHLPEHVRSPTASANIQLGDEACLNVQPMMNERAAKTGKPISERSSDTVVRQETPFLLSQSAFPCRIGLEMDQRT
jgi:hypothetical protein